MVASGSLGCVMPAFHLNIVSPNSLCVSPGETAVLEMWCVYLCVGAEGLGEHTPWFRPPRGSCCFGTAVSEKHQLLRGGTSVLLLLWFCISEVLTLRQGSETIFLAKGFAAHFLA